MEFQAVQYSVDRLVQWIRSGRLALPDFQRTFVWNPSRVVELLDSVARQWPIGSLLLLSGPQPFGIRAIADAPPLRGSKLDYYVLDGQQRLTSLYHAVSDVSDFCYYVDFAALLRDEDDYIKWEKREIFTNKYPAQRDRAAQSIALVKDVWELDAFYAWLEFVADHQLQRQYVSLKERRLGGLQAKLYKLMAIELDQDIQVEALARIFETLNRTGVKLNAFDLMVAILYPTGFHLRDKWEEARALYDIFEHFDVDPIEVLKLAALLIRGDYGRKAARGVRQGDLLELDRDLLRSYWDRSVQAYAFGLSYARDKLGVHCADAVPAASMILGLAAWLEVSKPAETEIWNWFWATSFAQVYAQAANTVVVADFDSFKSGSVEALISSRMADSLATLDEPARKNGLALRALDCFLAARGAVDPVSGEPLSRNATFAVRAIDESGELRRLGSEDSFDSVIFLSKESDRKLTKANEIPGFTNAPLEERRNRLRSQLISIDLLSRDIDELRNEIKDAFIWSPL